MLQKKFFIFAIAIFTILSCKNTHKTLTDTDKQSNDSIKYAKLFDIIKTDTSTILSVIDPWQGASNIKVDYHLISREKINPNSPLNHIPVPVQRIVTMSSSHLAFLDLLNSTSIVYGHSGVQYVYNSKIQDRIKNGEIVEVGFDQAINYELITKLQPDLVICYGVSNQSLPYLEKLKDLNIRYMLVGEYLEEHPLGKVEWLKVFGELTNKSYLADSIFNSICDSYNDAVSRVQKLEPKPKVLLNMPYSNVWYSPGRDNYFIRLIEDAGGEYLFDEKGSDSNPISFEVAYIAGRNADIWLNPGMANSKEDIEKLDNRMCKMQPYINDKIYNNNNRTTPSGGSDFWESGTVSPHVILKDLISIFGTDSTISHQLFYYKHIR